MKLLYAGTPMHPGYRFLFEDRSIAGEASPLALRLTGNLAAAPGSEIVPSERARALVAYLLSLNTAFDYPESRPVPPAATKGGAAPAAGHDAHAAPKGPEEKKEGKK